MTDVLLPPIPELRKAALTLFEWACRLDEPIKALNLLHHLPYVLDKDEEIDKAFQVGRGMISHLETQEAYEAFYDKIWEADTPTTRQGIEAVALQHRFQWAYQVAALREAREVLDLGSGNGAFALFMGLRGFNVVAVNLTKRAVDAGNAVATSLGVPVTFVHGPAEMFSAPGARAKIDFDLVTAFEIIEHVANPMALLMSMRNAVKPGGTCLLTTPNGSSTYGEDTWARRDRDGGKLGDPVAHVHAFTQEQIEGLLHSFGERITKPRITVEGGPGQGTLHAAWETAA